MPVAKDAAMNGHAGICTRQTRRESQSENSISSFVAANKHLLRALLPLRPAGISRAAYTAGYTPMILNSCVNTVFTCEHP